MGVLSWLKTLGSLGDARVALASRRERRDAARRRHRETGGPAWTDSDRHLGETAERVVADVTPGTPGHFGSVRTTRDDGVPASRRQS
jgi:hypothetical protein